MSRSLRTCLIAAKLKTLSTRPSRRARRMKFGLPISQSHGSMVVVGGMASDARSERMSSASPFSEVSTTPT